MKLICENPAPQVAVGWQRDPMIDPLLGHLILTSRIVMAVTLLRPPSESCSSFCFLEFHLLENCLVGFITAALTASSVLRVRSCSGVSSRRCRFDCSVQFLFLLFFFFPPVVLEVHDLLHNTLFLQRRADSVALLERTSPHGATSARKTKHQHH